MKKEINKAVETFHKIALGTKKAENKNVPESKLAAFVTVLTELLTARYEKNWYPENPDRGSGYRCIRVNSQSVDPTIRESLKRANIALQKGLIQTELTIWVDPGTVSVRIGEDGSIGMEVVDEEVHNLSKQLKLKKEQSGSQSGSESEDGFSSRSSSPSSSLSERSGSVSPPVSRSPVPPKSTRSSPAMEYNPYCPPIHVSYPQRYPRSPANQQPTKSLSPSPHHFQNQGRPVMVPLARPITSTSHGDVFQGHIPVSSVANYTRPRALFPNENGSMVNQASLAFSAYSSIPARNAPHATLFDIPAMA